MTAAPRQSAANALAGFDDSPPTPIENTIAEPTNSQPTMRTSHAASRIGHIMINSLNQNPIRRLLGLPPNPWRVSDWG